MSTGALLVLTMPTAVAGVLKTISNTPQVSPIQVTDLSLVQGLIFVQTDYVTWEQGEVQSKQNLCTPWCRNTAHPDTLVSWKAFPWQSSNKGRYKFLSGMVNSLSGPLVNIKKCVIIVKLLHWSVQVKVHGLGGEVHNVRSYTCISYDVIISW